MTEFPGLDDLASKVSALEQNVITPDLSDLISRVSALESKINTSINPIKVTQLYEDDSEIVYEKI